MAKRIPISFKETARDLKLYNYILEESDKSAFIKKALDFYIKYLEDLENGMVMVKKTTVKEAEVISKVEDSIDIEDMEGIMDIFSTRVSP